MDSDFQSKLKTVLSDPEAMAKISAIAQNLGSSPPQAAPPSVEDFKKNEPNGNYDVMSALSGFGSVESDPRIGLLNSLKPLLREEKRDRVDALVRALTVASMMKNFRK